MKLVCRYDGTHLIPSSTDSVEEWEKLRQGYEYKVEVKRARNPQFHRKAMALLQQVFDNQDKYENFEDLLVEFKLRTGWYKEHLTTKGNVIYVPKSIAFANMDEDTFAKFYSRAIDVAIKHFGCEWAEEFA